MVSPRTFERICVSNNDGLGGEIFVVLIEAEFPLGFPKNMV